MHESHFHVTLMSGTLVKLQDSPHSKCMARLGNTNDDLSMQLLWPSVRHIVLCPREIAVYGTKRA